MIKDRHREDRYSCVDCYTCRNYQTNSGPERIAMMPPSCGKEHDVQSKDECSDLEPMTAEEIQEIEATEDAINQFCSETPRMYF